MKKFLYKLVYLLGIHMVFRRLFQKKNVTILMFHKPSVKSFSFCIDYISKKHNIISLKDFLSYINGNIKSLPKYSVIITLDDGHKSNYNLLPIIKKYNFTPTIFISSGTVNTNRHYWTMHLNNKISDRKAINTTPYEKLSVILKQNDFYFEKEFENRVFLSLEEINKMKNFVDFQSHSVNHLSLPMCNDEIAEFEISNSKEYLNKTFDNKIYAFAFPFGKYSNRDIELVKKTGYKCAITVDFGYNNKNTNPYKLKRLSVNDTDNLYELIIKASGLWLFFKTLKF
jgi:peptidoglycan/xylan/chitin deacetylase (PgdA/CDA1 family)